MGSKIIKTGAGILYGVSNDTPQPGMRLTMHDGDVVLAILELDEAFGLTETLDNGREVMVGPGIVLDVAFEQGLRVETDGEGLTFYTR
jgi:hypothetical protein